MSLCACSSLLAAAAAVLRSHWLLRHKETAQWLLPAVTHQQLRCGGMGVVQRPTEGVGRGFLYTNMTYVWYFVHGPACLPKRSLLRLM